MSILRIKGQLKKAELDSVQAAAVKEFEANPKLKLKLLLIFEDFKGWEENPDWGDMTFYFEHGGKIAKIALVADSKRQAELMMFMGEGIRPIPMKFFPPGQIGDARQWLNSC
ncbi:MAG: STAS/SEC14 domain-containing protein [Phycisphaerales bacterium]